MLGATARRMPARENMKLTSIAIILLSCGLSACHPKVDACWSPATKSSAQVIAEQIFSRLIIDRIATAEKKQPADELKESIEKSIKVALSGFHVESADDQTGNLKCGAFMIFSFSKNGTEYPANKKYIEFQVVKSENGQDVLMGETFFNGPIIEVEEKMPTTPK
jgi:hypothetical protein